MAHARLSRGLLVDGEQAALAVEAGGALQHGQCAGGETQHFAGTIEPGPDRAVEAVLSGALVLAELELEVSAAGEGHFQFHLGGLESPLFPVLVVGDLLGGETGAQVAHQIDQLLRLGLAEGPVAGHGPAVLAAGQGDHLLGRLAFHPHRQAADARRIELGQRVDHRDLTALATQVGQQQGAAAQGGQAHQNQTNRRLAHRYSLTQNQQRLV